MKAALERISASTAERARTEADRLAVAGRQVLGSTRWW